SESTTAPASTGSVRTRMAAGSAVSSCSGRVMRSKKRQTGRNASLTVTSASSGCCNCCSTGPWCLVAYVSPGSSSTGNLLTVASAAPVTMLSAPGPIEEVTARVARRRLYLANAVAACTRACSLRPWMNGIASLSWSRAWPSPATLPWPKMPRVAGTSRRRWPSATEYCRDRYVTTAWATVSRTVWEVIVSPSLPGPAVQDHGLDVGHLGDRRAGAFLADPACLQPAVGHEVGPPQRGPVDVHGAGVDLPDGPDRAGHVGGEDAGAEPVGRAVGLRDRVLEVLGRADRDGRAEQFLLAERRPGVDPGDHRRGHDRAVALAAGQQLGSLGYGAADGSLDPFGLIGGDQRAHAGVGGPRVSGPDRLHFGHQRVEEVRGDGRVGDDPLHGDADLARVDVAARRNRAGGQFDVGVGQYDDRAGGAQLQGQLLDPGDPRDVLARGGRPRERDLAHPRVGDQGVAEAPAGAGEYGEHPVRQPGVGEAAGQGQRGQRGGPGRLEHDRVARRQG